MTIYASRDEDIRPRLEAIEYLARSANRVLVLEFLTGGPVDRREITDSTEFSRATLSRTLTEFEHRGWVSRSGNRIQLTVLGEFVAAEFGRLLDRMGVVEELRDVIRWFPDGGYGFDLSLLSTATIVRPKKEDALAPTNNLVGRIESAEHVRIMSYSMLPDTLETCWRMVTNGSQEVEFVLEPPVLNVIENNPTMASHMEDLIESGAADIFTYQRDLPFVVIIADDAVNLCLSGQDGSPHAMIDTTDDEIHGWAERTYESYRREAVPLESETLRS